MGISGVSGGQGFAVPPWDKGSHWDRDIMQLLKSFFSNPLNPNKTEENQLRYALILLIGDPKTPHYLQDLARDLKDQLEKYDQVSHDIESYKQELQQPGLPKERVDQLNKLLADAEKQQESMQELMTKEAQHFKV